MQFQKTLTKLNNVATTDWQQLPTKAQASNWKAIFEMKDKLADCPLINVVPHTTESQRAALTKLQIIDSELLADSLEIYAKDSNSSSVIMHALRSILQHGDMLKYIHKSASFASRMSNAVHLYDADLPSAADTRKLAAQLAGIPWGRVFAIAYFSVYHSNQEYFKQMLTNFQMHCCNIQTACGPNKNNQIANALNGLMQLAQQLEEPVAKYSPIIICARHRRVIVGYLGCKWIDYLLTLSELAPQTKELINHCYSIEKKEHRAELVEHVRAVAQQNKQAQEETTTMQNKKHLFTLEVFVDDNKQLVKQVKVGDDSFYNAFRNEIAALSVNMSDYLEEQNTIQEIKEKLSQLSPSAMQKLRDCGLDDKKLL